MLIYNHVVIDEAILFEKFCCNLSKCMGQCCVEGELGAPVLSKEIDDIERNLPTIECDLPKKNREVIKEKGFYEAYRGDLYLQTIDSRECVFTIQDEQGIVGCLFEKAYLRGASDFIKPVSCHLFPIRVKTNAGMDVLEYMQIPECKPARELGEESHVSVYQFLKKPLARKYGKEWAEGFITYCEFQKEKVFCDLNFKF